MPELKKLNILHFTPAIVWGISILYFSLMPGNELPKFLLSAQDVLLHFGIYFGQSVLLMLGFNHFSIRSVSASQVMFILILTLFLGVIIEFVQEKFIEGRHFEWSDILFNSLGAIVAVFLNRFLRKPDLAEHTHIVN